MFVISWNYPPPRMPVTTRIIPFLVGNPYKPSFVTVTGWGVDQSYIISIYFMHCGSLWHPDKPPLDRKVTPQWHEKWQESSTSHHKLRTFLQIRPHGIHHHEKPPSWWIFLIFSNHLTSKSKLPFPDKKKGFRFGKIQKIDEKTPLRVDVYPQSLTNGTWKWWVSERKIVLQTSILRYYVSFRDGIPGTQMTSIFEGQPHKARPFRTKRRVIWVPSIYMFKNHKDKFFRAKLVNSPKCSKFFVFWQSVRTQNIFPF